MSAIAADIHVRRVAIAGNPNSGKSTIFNALTGLRQKVGNYPGVTVERKEGSFFGSHGEPMTLLDLPGSYSLQIRSPDEAVARDVLLGRIASIPRPEVIIAVVDASNSKASTSNDVVVSGSSRAGTVSSSRTWRALGAGRRTARPAR